MSDLLRMTGMYSGMDTEAVIQSLVSAKSKKVTNLKNDQKKLEWKQDIWQKLNTKLYSLYSKTLSNLRFSSSFAKKKTKVSDPTKATILAGDSAVNGSQTLRINQLAKSAYLTGAEISKVSRGEVKGDWKLTDKLCLLSSNIKDSELTVTEKVKGDWKLTDKLCLLSSNIKDSELTVTVDGVDHTIQFDDNTTIGTNASESGNSLEEKFAVLGIELTFDETSQTMTLDTKGHKVNMKTSTGDSALRPFGLDDFFAEDLEGVKVGKTMTKGVDHTIQFDDNTTIGANASDPGNSLVEKFATWGITLTFDEENQTMTLDTNSKTVNMKTSKGDSALRPFGLGDFSAEDLEGVVTGKTMTKEGDVYEKGNFENASKLSDISSELIGRTISLTVGKGADKKITNITITAEMKISDFVNKLREGGVNASFDENNQRFFVSSSGTGADKEFELDADADIALYHLGLWSDPAAGTDSGTVSTPYKNGSTSSRIYAQDAEIELNGATFTSGTNTFSINGLSITANAVTDEDEELTITTDTDYDGIYEMIKDFLTEYNEIMNEMNNLYSADSARKYDMLTEEQKESMSDDEVEKWEDTIKNSLLRRDNTLYSVMSCMRDAINDKYTVNGKELYLKNFGIGTLSYFTSTKENRYSLHIDGDPDDEATATEKDRLKTALAEDPESVIGLFTQMAKKMYDSLHESMGSTEYSSIYKVYDDKKMKSDYDSYSQKIKDAEKKLSDYEDKWYKKFSAMEVALSKLQSTQSTISSMLGM